MQASPPPHVRPFTGWHMTAIMVSFFGVVFAVNVYMAGLASSTFSGEVVGNSYVASQHFNRWLDEAAKEKALGWDATVTRQIDGRLAVSVTGPNTGDARGEATLVGEAWRPLGKAVDMQVNFRQIGPGSFISAEALPAGRWKLRLALSANGKLWRSEESL